MSGLFGDLWDGLQGGFLRKPLKKATGMSDAQLAGAAALAIAAPYALPSAGAAGGASGASGTGGAASGGIGGFFEGLMGGGQSLTGGAPGFSGGQAAAPIVDASSAASPQTVQGLGAAGKSADWLGSAGKVATIGEKTGLLGGKEQAPMQVPELPQFQDVSGGLLSGLDEMQRKRMARRGLLGDGYGAA